MTTFGEYAARGRTAWWRYPVATVLALLIAFVLGVVVVAGLALGGRLTPQIAAEIAKPTQPLVFFTTAGLSFGLLLVGFVAAIALVHAKRFGDVVGRWPWRLFWYGAGLWLAFELLATVIDFAIAPRAFTITAAAMTPGIALVAFAALAVQTFAEEFVFRGYLTQGLLRLVGRPLPAAVLSGLAFGALHIANGLPQAAGALAVGVVGALIAIRTGGIAFTWGLHLVNNLFGGLAVVSASDVFKGAPGLVTQNTPQLMWWDAGVEVAALLAVLWLVMRARPAPDAAAPLGED